MIPFTFASSVIRFQQIVVHMYVDGDNECMQQLKVGEVGGGMGNCEEVVANHLMQEWVESTKCGHLSLFLRSRLSQETQTVLSGAHVVYSFIIMAVISQVMHP